jgi:Predicted hydrolases or acyltransferases (alpha/beta hydrolase superfamily)
MVSMSIVLSAFSVFVRPCCIAIVAVVTLVAVSPAKAEYAKLSDELTLHYEQAGQGPETILFIPGWTMSTKVFERQFKHFEASTRFRAIAYDPRGQGLSSKTLDGHTYQQHGRDLAAFIEKLRLNDVVLAGWSYGVLEMMAYVNQFGAAKVKAVVVIDGTPRALGKDNTKEWVWVSLDDKDKFRENYTIQTLENRPALNVEFAKWMLEAATPENIRWVDNIASQTPNFIAALTNETGTYINYEQDLKALNGKLPLLFVVREEWRQIVSDWVKANAPAAELVVMGKHLMFWERSQEFNAALDRFLAGLR